MVKNIFVFLYSILLICILITSIEVSAQSATAISYTTQDRSVSTCTSFADIIEPLLPTVVNIYTVKYNKKSQQFYQTPFPDNLMFDNFLRDFFEQFNTPFNLDDMYSNPKAISLGSGFIIDAEGYIVTNHHVISNADEIYIKQVDNVELPAKLIGADQRSDLALLKIDPRGKKLPYVKFGDSNKARVGDWVIAIGNPFGLGGTVTIGIISSKSRDINVSTGGVVDDFIQTDAAINTGNSGGPMFNLQGEVIAINTAIFSPSGTNVGIGFSIPSNTAQNIIQQLKKNGKISRGRLDITIQEVTPDIVEGLGLPQDTLGALVAGVLPRGAGAKAGLKSGDVITEFAEQQVKNARKLQVLVAEATLGEEVPIVILRNGKKQLLVAKITEGEEISKQLTVPYTAEATNDNNSELYSEKSGIVFSNLTADLKRKYTISRSSIEGGVVVVAIKKSSNANLRVGDVIIEINQHPISNINDLNEYYQNAKTAKKQNLVLLVKRRSADIFVALPVL